MNFRQLQDQVLIILGRTASTADPDALFFARQSINQTIQDIATRAQFRFLERQGDFITVAPVTAGTITKTNNSRTIAGSGTSFTADMVGREFRVDGDEIVYTIIAFVSPTDITIDRVYQGATASAQNYSIFKNRYSFRLDFDHLVSIKERSSAIDLTELHEQQFDRFVPDPENIGDPRFYFIYGQQRFAHNDGTLAVTNGLTAVTGTGSNWEVDPGSINGIDDHILRVITIGTDNTTYIVQNIVSSTSLTLERPYEGITSASSTYSMVGDFKTIFLDPIPDDLFEMEYKFFKIPDVLGVDTDISDIHPKYDSVTVAGSKYRLAQLKRPDVAVQHFAEYEAGIKNMINDNRVSSYRLDQMQRYSRGTNIAFPRINVNWSTLR